MKGNDEQIAFWNGEGGRRWVAQNALIDAMIRPIGEATLAHAAPAPSERALDVGCGCGNQSLALARRIGPGGAVLGVDVSEPMLAEARALAAADAAPRAELAFRSADAASGDIGEGHDLLFSRFGVMFFADPVAAFAHLRRALRPGGRLVACCWRTLAENELMTLPLSAALAHLPAPPAVDPHAPGPFAFAARERVLGILAEAGFRDAAMEPLDCALGFGGGPDAVETARRLLDLGPAARMLADATPDVRARVLETLSASIAPRIGPEGLALTARCWILSGRSR